MLMFNFKKDAAVKNIYQNIIDRSRCKSFYIDYDIEDRFESRFDLVVLHSFIIFQYFLDTGMKKNKLSQSIFDLMFQDFENNLREMGFGDIAVNKKMKLLNKIFYDILLKINTKNDETYKTSINIIKKYFPEISLTDQNNASILADYFDKFFNFCFDIIIHILLPICFIWHFVFPIIWIIIILICIWFRKRIVFYG